MKSKWSKIIKADHETFHVETVALEEFHDDTESASAEGHQDAEIDGHEPEPVDSVSVEHDCALLQQESYEAGYAKGFEDGQGQLRAQVEAELAHALNLATQAGLARLRALEEMEQTVVALALAVAKKVIGREATVDKALIVQQVQRVIAYLGQSLRMTIRVNPDDAPCLESLRVANQENVPIAIEIQRDPDMERGGCLIETQSLVVDATIERQLAVIHERLLSPEPEGDPE